MAVLLQSRRKLDLINVKLDPGIIDIERNDLFDEVFLMIVKDLHVKITEEI